MRKELRKLDDFIGNILVNGVADNPAELVKEIDIISIGLLDKSWEELMTLETETLKETRVQYFQNELTDHLNKLFKFHENVLKMMAKDPDSISNPIDTSIYLISSIVGTLRKFEKSNNKHFDKDQIVSPAILITECRPFIQGETVNIMDLLTNEKFDPELSKIVTSYIRSQ